MVPFIISQNLTSFDEYTDQKDGLSAPVDHFSEHHHTSTFSFPMYEANSQFSSHQNFDPTHPEGSVIGNPTYDMQFWHKQSFNDCDVVAQQMGLESLTAKHFSESALLHEAIRDGSHLATGGTPADYIGHLYETHGFPIERHHDGTIDELKERLTEGQKVVVAVNSDILWANESQVPDWGSVPANHSVEVIGIVYPNNDTEHPKIILNDPGIDNGQGVMVPLQQFEHAWATSHHLIAATNLPDTHTVLRDSYTTPYTTIDDSNGYIYKHVGSDSDWAGWIRDSAVYNWHGDYLGRGGTDGNVYDEHNNVIGHVDPQGHVYNSAGVEVYQTTRGVVGAAAYLLCVYNGNVP